MVSYGCCATRGGPRTRARPDIRDASAVPEFLRRTGAVVAALAFVGRVVQVLWRFPRRAGTDGETG
ncbi:DUF6332 family protein, partial [Streptomyces sp. NPDC050804]|uniref:DUF6332 family protein n=1 Tax=Streptomyces sp. NPDC050804 TaxID=3154745 RepID=UPI00341A32ED